MWGVRSICARVGSVIVLAIGCSATVGAATVGTTFTYQGQLQRDGGAYTGTCNMQFSLWDAATDGVQKGDTKSITNVSVVNGLFTVGVDFGEQFSGNARWLEAAVQCTGDTGFTPLTPRQQLTATPYALSLHPGAVVLGDLPGKGVVTANNVTTGVGSGLVGISHGGGAAVSGVVMNDGNGPGVSGVSASGTGLYGESTAGFALHAKGLFKLEQIASGTGAGSEPLCRNGALVVATCNSSSLRYKEHVAPLSAGLDLVRRLRPITFTWKADGTQDLGLGAEDVAAVEPLLVTHNDRGEIEGVRYDRLNAVLINAIKDQQAQIEAQTGQLDAERRMVTSQHDQILRQQGEIERLRELVCLDHPDASACVSPVRSTRRSPEPGT